MRIWIQILLPEMYLPHPQPCLQSLLAVYSVLGKQTSKTSKMELTQCETGYYGICALVDHILNRTADCWSRSCAREPRATSTTVRTFTFRLVSNGYHTYCTVAYPTQIHSNLSAQKNRNFVCPSVADPGCLSRIRIFSSRIQGQKDSGSRIGIRIKVFLTQKIVSKLSEI